MYKGNIRKGILNWVRRLVKRGSKRTNRTGRGSAQLSAVWVQDPVRIERARRLGKA